MVGWKRSEKALIRALRAFPPVLVRPPPSCFQTSSTNISAVPRSTDLEGPCEESPRRAFEGHLSKGPSSLNLTGPMRIRLAETSPAVVLVAGMGRLGRHLTHPCHGDRRRLSARSRVRYLDCGFDSSSTSRRRHRRAFFGSALCVIVPHSLGPSALPSVSSIVVFQHAVLVLRVLLNPHRHRSFGCSSSTGRRRSHLQPVSAVHH